MRCVLAALVMAISFAAPTGAAPATAPRGAVGGSIGLRLVDVPTAVRNDPRARVYIVDHLPPGTVIHRRIEVSNTTASVMHVVLYPAAAAIANGAFLGSAGHTPNELSTWAAVSPGSADVPADGRVTAGVTITIPRDAAPGERYGVVWAEARSPAAASNSVVQVSRVGIRLYLSVGAGGPPASNFTIRSLTAERSTYGQPLVVATVHNNGGRALDMNGTLRLSRGPAGLSAGPFPAALGVTLAIGDTEGVTITLDKRLPAGPWDAQITLHSGLLERSARATLTFPDAGRSPAVSATPARSGWPRAPIAVLLLCIAAGALVALKRSGRTTIARRPRPSVS